METPTLLSSAKGSASVIAGKVLIFGAAFGFTAIFARVAGKGLVGEYSYVTSVLAIVSVTTLSGMPIALIRAVARGHDGSLASMTKKRLTVGLLGTVTSAAISVWYFVHGNTLLGTTFLVAAPFVPLTDTMSDMTFAYFQGKKLFGKSASLAVAYQLMFTVPALILILLTGSLSLIIGGILFFQALAGWIVYSSIQPETTSRDTESENLGMHLSVMGVLRTLGNNIDTIITWFLFGPITTAIYTLASVPVNKIEQLVPIEQVALPALSQQDHSSTAKSRLLKRTGLLFLMAIMACAALFGISHLLYKIFFPRFTDSVPFFRALLLILLTTPFTLLKTGLVAWHMRKELYTIEVVSLAVKVPLMILLGSHYGIWGLVSAVIITRIIEALVILGLFLFKKTPEATA